MQRDLPDFFSQTARIPHPDIINRFPVFIKQLVIGGVVPQDHRLAHCLINIGFPRNGAARFGDSSVKMPGQT